MSIEAVAWAFNQTTGDPLSKSLLIHMCNAANPEHDYLCWHRIDIICERTEMSRSTVKRHTKSLMEMGYITLIEKGGRSEGADRTNKFRVNYLALKDKVTSSERTGKKQSTSSERTPQGVQSEPVKGVTVNPKKVIRKVKEKEEEISSSFFVELLVSQYGFDESKFTEKHSAIFDRWELENVTEKEIEGSHAIASKNKGSPNDVTIQYLNGIIFKRREEAKPSKPPPANRPHQTKSTDIENTPEIKAKNDEAHWERMKALGYGEHIHERLQGAES